MKTNISQLAVSLISRLFENFHNSKTNEDNDLETIEIVEDDNIDDPKEKEMTLSEKLDEFLASSSKPATKIVLDKKDITAVVKHEMNIFEQTKNLPDNSLLKVLYNALLTIPPTSVESERAFSIFGYFCNKVRSSLKPATINALIFLREYYRNMS